MKKLESGRSMVEMLGVLAIIGVLSIGGIAGYTLSMRRHRANGVADIVAKYALVSYGQCQQKILNGDASDVTACNSYAFDNAGIGSLPAGVDKMELTGMSVGSDGNDVVSIKTKFQDQKLCEALGSISGSTCSNKEVTVKIKQN